MKSPPELWAEVSDAASLARHLGEVGEIAITRLEPETTVAWEGERASGTVELAPAGWGTSVTLTAEPAGETTRPAQAEPPAAEPEPVAAAEPQTIGIEGHPAAELEPEPAAERKRSWFQRLFGKRHSAANADRAGGAEDARAPGEDPGCARPEATGPARASAEPERDEPDPWESVLTSALDSLGQAHHRPFSRG